MFEKILAWFFGTEEAVPVEVDRFLGILGDGTDPDHVVEFEEAVGFDASVAAALDLPESKPNEWRTFLAQYQSGSSACVAFTIAMIAQILYFLKYARKVKFSPGWIYRRRKNRPGQGMSIDDVIELAGAGMITEELYPSENLSEKNINALPDVEYGPDVAEAFAIPTKWVNLPKDFETVAKSLIATEKGIMIWFKFGKGEFFDKAIPVSVAGVKQQYAHSITAVQAVKYKGQEYILTYDSADDEDLGLGKGRKLISRDWFSQHVYLARYPLRFKFEPETASKPRYDGSIGSLQDCLTYEGFFPSNVTARGFMGAITIQAIKDFQNKYSLEQIGNVGPKTSAKLKELYP